MIGLVFGTADLCDMLSAQAHAFGVGYRMTSDHRLAACCDELVADPGTRALAIGIDQLADGPAFFASADRARAAGKPVVLHSFDRFDRFERPGPAISVTSLEAACETHGILFVEHGLDLIPLAAVLASTGPLRAEGIGIAADSSRAAEMITRLLIASGIDATKVVHATGIGALASDPSIGVVLDLGAADRDADSTCCVKPVIRIDADVMTRAGTLQPGNAHSAVRIAAQLVRDYRQRRAWRHPPAIEPLNDATIALLDRTGLGPLGEHLTKQLLTSAGVAVTREGVARSPYEAAQIAREVRYPVAMKAEAQGLTNRHSIGAIELGLTTPDEVFEAFRAIEKAVSGQRAFAFEGCLVQEMIEGPIELLVATHWTPSIGAMLEVGFGGKLLIHPKQIAPVRAGLRPSEAEIALARRIVEAAARQGEGAISLDGRMIDVPVLTKARRIVSQAG